MLVLVQLCVLPDWNGAQTAGWFQKNISAGPQNRSEDVQVQSGSSLNVRSGLSCQNRHHVAAAGLFRQVVRCLTSSVLQPHARLAPETRKTGDDVMKWEELSK